MWFPAALAQVSQQQHLPLIITDQQGFSPFYFLFLTCHFIPRLSLDIPPNAPHISVNLEFFVPWFLSRGLPRTTSIRTHTFCANTSVEPFLYQEFPSIFSHSFLISPLSPSNLGISSFLSISPNLNRNNFSHNFPSNKRAVFSSVKVSGDTILCLPNPHYSHFFFFNF